MKFKIGLFLQAARNVSISPLFIEECTFDPIVGPRTKFVYISAHAVRVVQHHLVQKSRLVVTLQHRKFLISALTQPSVVVGEDRVELFNTRWVVCLQINHISSCNKPALDCEIAEICLHS